jgi:hypothetical protein
MKLFFHKLFHWEYWPSQVVYFPIYFLGIFCAIRARSFFFFNAANPTMKNGGFMAESKKEIYDLIPQQYYPKTELIQEKTSFDAVLQILEKSQIKFPFIAKPDIGLRGSAVKKINSIDELKKYSEKANFDFLLQDLIPFENEIGVFYVRFPPDALGEKLGKITGIVRKEFLIVTGDGKSSVLDLILQNPRYALQLKVLMKEYGWRLNDVLRIGEKRNLVPYGNHIRGAKFLDDSHLISDKLNAVFNEICLQIDGFYFGRLDVMFSNYEDLENGKNFQIVEVNGAASEPTHIYDPKHSLFFAWKELARHIEYMYKISAQNHKKGVKYLSYKEGRKQFKLHYEQSSKIVNF